jgi:hypothetical protein
MKKYKCDVLIPEVKTLVSWDLHSDKLPDDVEECKVFCEAAIGIKGEIGADIFSFKVVTPKFLWHQQGQKWGKGLLIVETFSWEAVKTALDKLLSYCTGTDWIEISDKLTKHLDWEYEIIKVKRKAC